jgi:hypothetical protein
MTLIASEPVESDREIPLAPLALGLAGLGPFIALSLTLALHGPTLAGIAIAPALLAYGAAILSFLGGVHWGLALRHPAADTRNALYAAAVAPPLWAWAGLMVGGAGGLAMMAAGLAAHGLVDAGFSGRCAAPRWYPRLRLWLSMLATIAVAAAAVVVQHTP